LADWDALRALALALPGVREVDWHGEPWFQVGSKAFLLGSGGRVIMKLERGHQELLFEVRPEVFSPMMVGRLRWSWVEVDELDAGELAALVREAWTQIVPKKVSRAFSAA
jgi:hypothetical protein